MRHDHHQLILGNAHLIVQSEVGSGLLGCRSLQKSKSKEIDVRFWPYAAV